MVKISKKEKERRLKLKEKMKKLTGSKNNNWKGGKIIKKCEICNKNMKLFPSQKHRKTCSKKCADISRKNNSAKPNLGKNKYNCKHIRKLSEMKKGVKRTKQEKINISKGTKKGMHKKNNWEKFLEGIKNRDMSSMKNPEVHQKRCKTQSKNIFYGKFIYKDIRMRSSWEIKFAEYLDKKNIKWKYEPKTFKLKTIDICYTPDFYLIDLNIWVEVKGYFTERSKKQCKSFVEETNNFLCIIDKKKMQELNLL